MKNNKFWTYLNKKGFYAILLLCILTVIGTTTFITKNNMNTLDKVNEQNSIDLDEDIGDYDLEDVGTINAYQNDLDVSNKDAKGAGSGTAEDASTQKEKKVDVASKEQNSITVASNEKEDKKQETSNSKEKVDENKKQKAPEEVEETFGFSENMSIVWPVLGQIVMDYSDDKLVYDKTLEEYITHPAVCIAPSEEGKVKAAAKGRVEMIKNDPETGITVIINHGDGWKTIYGQLQKEVSVKQNQVVEKGEVIGEIGSPTKYSVLLGNHVYFKVTKDDKTVDPKQFLNSNTKN